MSGTGYAVRTRKRRVKRQVLADVIQCVVEAADSDKIILFGSAARGEMELPSLFHHSPSRTYSVRKSVLPKHKGRLSLRFRLKPDRTWLATSGHVQAIVFAANGDTLIGRCAFPDHIEVWDCRKGLLRLTLPLGDTADLAVAVSPDGRTLTAAAGEGLKQWDLATGRPRGHSLRTPGRVLSLSPDGKLVLILARDESLRISNVSSLIKE